jgi:hypothetical protein
MHDDGGVLTTSFVETADLPTGRHRSDHRMFTLSDVSVLSTS